MFLSASADSSFWGASRYFQWDFKPKRNEACTLSLPLTFPGALQKVKMVVKS